MMWFLVALLVITNVMAILAYIGKDRPYDPGSDQTMDDHRLKKIKFSAGYWQWFCTCGAWAPARLKHDRAADTEDEAFQCWDTHRRVWEKALALEPLGEGDRAELEKYRSTCICQNLLD